MQASFKKIGVVGRSQQSGLREVLQQLVALLEARGLEVVLEDRLGEVLPEHSQRLATRDEIGKATDLIIVVGGDGSLLSAARTLAKYETPVLGVNRGRLGFLTDITPDEMAREIPPVLEGNFERESRFLLDADVRRDGVVVGRADALYKRYLCLPPAGGRTDSLDPNGVHRLLPVRGRAHYAPHPRCHVAGAHVSPRPEQSPHCGGR
jgi:NAD+ kinase